MMTSLRRQKGDPHLPIDLRRVHCRVIERRYLCQMKCGT